MDASAEPGASLPIFRFVGHSGSGKTTLLERVIAALVERGLRVAVAKDTHHEVELDQPGKDSWRLARAGASQVVVTAPGRLVLFQRHPSRPTLAEVGRLVAAEADVLLAEGYRDDEQPAVVVWRAAVGRGLPAMRGPVCAVVCDGATGLEAPSFGFEEVEGLVRYMLGSTCG